MSCPITYPMSLLIERSGLTMDIEKWHRNPDDPSLDGANPEVYKHFRITLYNTTTDRVIRLFWTLEGVELMPSLHRVIAEAQMIADLVYRSTDFADWLSFMGFPAGEGQTDENRCAYRRSVHFTKRLKRFLGNDANAFAFFLQAVGD